MTLATLVCRWELGMLAASEPSAESSGDAGLLALGGVAALVALGIAGVFFAHRRRCAAQQCSPAELFLELCRAHELDRAQRTLLKQVAQQQRLGNTVRLFTEPQWLERAQAGGAFRGQTKQLQTLCRVLFAADGQ